MPPRNMTRKSSGQMLPRFFGVSDGEYFSRNIGVFGFLGVKCRGVSLLVIAPRDVMPHDDFFNFLFHHVVHLAFVREKRIGGFAALLLVLCPPAMPARIHPLRRVCDAPARATCRQSPLRRARDAANRRDSFR